MKKSQSSEKYSPEILINLSSFPCIETEVRVRYSETDRMGVAHNKNYFEWFEIGRTEYCRSKGIPYKSIEERGFYLVVVEAFCRYKKALRYDERFLIKVYLKELSPKKVGFAYELVSKDRKELLAAGYTIHIVTNAETQVCALPQDILDKIK